MAVSGAIAVLVATGILALGFVYEATAPEEPGTIGPTCVVTGCSGQVCASEEVVTTCEWMPTYACYEAAPCEVQADGECGWTPTEELLSCL